MLRRRLIVLKPDPIRGEIVKFRQFYLFKISLTIIWNLQALFEQAKFVDTGPKSIWRALKHCIYVLRKVRFDQLLWRAHISVLHRFPFFLLEFVFFFANILIWCLGLSIGKRGSRERLWLHWKLFFLNILILRIGVACNFVIFLVLDYLINNFYAF